MVGLAWACTRLSQVARNAFFCDSKCVDCASWVPRLRQRPHPPAAAAVACWGSWGKWHCRSRVHVLTTSCKPTPKKEYASNTFGCATCLPQAVEAWLQETGSLPVNVKFLLEGQEEVMSPHLTAFLHKHK